MKAHNPNIVRLPNKVPNSSFFKALSYREIFGRSGDYSPKSCLLVGKETGADSQPTLVACFVQIDKEKFEAPVPKFMLSGGESRHTFFALLEIYKKYEKISGGISLLDQKGNRLVVRQDSSGDFSISTLTPEKEYGAVVRFVKDDICFQDVLSLFDAIQENSNLAFERISLSEFDSEEDRCAKTLVSHNPFLTGVAGASTAELLFT